MLNKTVTDVNILVIFYNEEGVPIATNWHTVKEPIPGGLAVRVKGTVDGSIQELTSRRISNFSEQYERKPYTKLEFRILDFRIVE